jgi:hypothetical protein
MNTCRLQVKESFIPHPSNYFRPLNVRDDEWGTLFQRPVLVKCIGLLCPFAPPLAPWFRLTFGKCIHHPSELDLRSCSQNPQTGGAEQRWAKTI